MPNNLGVRPFAMIINLEPTYHKAKFSLGRVFFTQQKFDSAINQMEQILELDNEYIKAYELIADIYIKQNNLTLAERYCLDGLEVNSKSYPLYARLAGINNDEEYFDLAMQNANKALDIKRNYGPALIELGRANINLCNKVAAEDALNRAKRYDRRQVAQLLDLSKEHFKNVCK